MESSRKRKGFIKSKLVMTLYRATKPAASMPISGKVKPDPFPKHASVDYMVEGKPIGPITKQRVMDVKKKGDEGLEVGLHATDGINGGEKTMLTKGLPFIYLMSKNESGCKGLNQKGDNASIYSYLLFETCSD